jgi:hypothetical protein
MTQNTMNLWLIERTGETWYDENIGHVIAAYQAQTAREIAAKAAVDEGEGPWLDPKRSEIVLIGEAVARIKREGIVQTSFHAG